MRTKSPPMMDSDFTWRAVIKAAGGPTVVGGALGESPSTVSGWGKRPGGVPGKHWSAIAKLALDAGKPEITLEVLADVAARHAAAFEDARL